MLPCPVTEVNRKLQQLIQADDKGRTPLRNENRGHLSKKGLRLAEVHGKERKAVINAS